MSLLAWLQSAKGAEKRSCDGGAGQSQSQSQSQTQAPPLSHIGDHQGGEDSSGTRSRAYAGSSNNDREIWSSPFLGMVTSLRPRARQSQSPSRRSNRASASAARSSHQQQQQQQQQEQQRQHRHHHQHLQQTRLDTYSTGPTLHEIDDSQNGSFESTESPSSSTPLSDSGRPAKRLKLTVRKPTVTAPRHAATSSVPANDQSANTLRPPAKLSVSDAHGNIVQTTNGVQTNLQVTQDGKHTRTSRCSTPHSSSKRETRGTHERRSLRSHDEGPRLKSELATYFPNYEDIIYDVPEEPELLEPNTIIHLVDKESQTASRAVPKASSSKSKEKPVHALTSPTQQERNRYNGAQVIDFSSIEKSVGHHPKDPLNDAFYFKSHRRAERREKQLRNIEKERAMHEKAQLERLLGDLEGHDWLRTMGITGKVDSENREFEPKRDYFIAEVRALLMKFKMWREEEKRMKLEKEAAAMAEEEEDEDGEEEDEDEAGMSDMDDGENDASDVGGVDAADINSSDLDASAGRQLQMEASGGKPKGWKEGKGAKSGDKGKGRSPAQIHPRMPVPSLRPPTPEGPFTSFYAKPHLRAAALGKARHGRNLSAFGHALPELEEREFSLPEGYLTAEAIKDSARRRRRAKRESAFTAQ